MIKAVCFDLDGTIIDTNELIIQSFQHVFKAKNMPREYIIEQMGKPLSEQMQFFSDRKKEEAVDDLIKQYRTFNGEQHDHFVTAFPKVKEVITALQEQSIRLAVVTSKIRMTTERSLTWCKLDGYFESIVTIDDVTHPKPHPEPVQKALAALNLHPSEVIMVGDSPFDIQSAKAAGVISVAVGWSLKGTTLLKQYEPDYVIDHMEQLLEVMEKENAR
ncbi:pyrophosphatase PpaX [Longirhabdus pacifica]|uniref:pyrophosphatase PpaX n=1 Tax=Longirhabdus pacifica TaxID=2305227 RepID=UPI001008CCA7|nr:pyrophosphatase PpaX [Longirhabdus pacifica]